MSKYNVGDFVWFVPNNGTGFFSPKEKIKSIIIDNENKNMATRQYIIKFIDCNDVVPSMQIEDGIGCFANENMLKPFTNLASHKSNVCGCGKPVKPSDDGECYDCWNKKHQAMFR